MTRKKGRTQAAQAKQLLIRLSRYRVPESSLRVLERLLGQLDDVLGEAQNDPTYGGKSDGSITGAAWGALFELRLCGLSVVTHTKDLNAAIVRARNVMRRSKR